MNELDAKFWEELTTNYVNQPYYAKRINRRTRKNNDLCGYPGCEEPKATCWKTGEEPDFKEIE